MHTHQTALIRIKPLNSPLICRPSSCVFYEKEEAMNPLACNALMPVGINHHIA